MGDEVMKSPHIRFEGFRDEWEKRKLEDICSIITKQTGFDYSATIKPSLITEKLEGTYPFIQNKDFEGTNINLNTDFYIPISVANKYPKITLDQPSLLISISGRIGNVGFYSMDSKSFIGGAVGICKLNDVEDGKVAMYELLSPSGQKYFASLTKASSHANITVEDIRKISVLLPTSNNEKKKINNYFEQLDRIITLHQRKLDLLKVTKKSMLQKMFPKDGESVPEIRFTGFTDAWEPCMLSDIAQYRNGKAHEKDINENGVYIVVNSKFVSTNGLIKKFSNKLIEPLKLGEIVFVLSDVPNGKALARTFLIDEDEKYSLNQRIAGITPHKETDSYFLNILMNRNDYFLKFDNGVGQTNLSRSEVESFLEFYPCYEEQVKIGGYFYELDTLINLHQRELDVLKDLKKSTLQQMFI